MSLLFNPPLDQLTTIKIPRHDLDLTFSAKFSNAEQHNAMRSSGVRVELWSDILNIEWGARPFEWSDDSLVLTISSAAIMKPLSAFTYRLVYPHGEIKWLGDYGKNGELLVGFHDERVELANGWRNEGKSVVLASSVADSAVLKLSNKAEWVIWTLPTER